MKFEKPYLEILLFDEEEILTGSQGTNALNEATNATIMGEQPPAQAAVSVDINQLTIRN